MPAHHPDRSRERLGLTAFAGTFLLIPLWDVYALFVSLRAAWQSLSPDKRTAFRLLLSHPVRRLLVLAGAYGLAWAGLGLLGRQMAQPGPFGVLATGLNHLPEQVAAQPCCEVSAVIAPGEPVAALIGARLPLTLGLLAAATVLGGVLITLLLGVSAGLRRLSERRTRLGRALRLLWWLATGALAAPVGAAALLVVLLGGARLGLIPVGAGRSLPGLLAAALVVAALPALLSARAAQHGGKSPLASAGLTSAGAFFAQAGWLLSSAIAAETVFQLDGLGALLVEGFARGDVPVIVGVVQALAPLLLVMLIRAEITDGVRWSVSQARVLDTSTRLRHEPEPDPARWPRLVLALLVTLAPLIAAAAWAPLQGEPPDPAAVYERPSAAHPLGTDHLGRDVRGPLSAAVLDGWAAAAVAGLVALAFGGLWGGLAEALAGWRGQAGRVLAALLLLPAAAAILVHPALVALRLRLAAGGATVEQMPVLWLGAALGLILVPRVARALAGAFAPADASQQAASWPGAALVALAMAAFAAFQYIQIAEFIWAGTLALPGSLLARHRELIVGAQLAPGGPYLRLAVVLAVPGMLTGAGAFLLQDALTGTLAPRQADVLPRLLN